MIDASTYKVLAELSKSGRFRFVKDKENNTLLAGEDEGKISFEIHLIEDIEVVKLTVTTQTPKGATYVTSVSDSIAGKDRLDISSL